MTKARSQKAESIGIYEAKTQLSKLIRMIKRHKVSFQISERGKPVALLSPVTESDGLEAHLAELQVAGILAEPADVDAKIECISKKPGALKRFLNDRD